MARRSNTRRPDGQRDQAGVIVSTHTQTFDELGRLLRQIGAASQTTTYGYEKNGFGEVIRQTSPDTGITDYARDARGPVTQMTDARGIVTQYAYGDAGHARV
jgi:YD repeat-containing protein